MTNVSPTLPCKIQFSDYDLIRKKEPGASQCSAGINPINQSSESTRTPAQIPPSATLSSPRCLFVLERYSPLSAEWSTAAQWDVTLQADVTLVQSGAPVWSCVPLMFNAFWMDLQLDLWSFCLLLDALRCPAEYKLQKTWIYLPCGAKADIKGQTLSYQRYDVFFCAKTHLHSCRHFRPFGTHVNHPVSHRAGYTLQPQDSTGTDGRVPVSAHVSTSCNHAASQQQTAIVSNSIVDTVNFQNKTPRTVLGSCLTSRRWTFQYI